MTNSNNIKIIHTKVNKLLYGNNQHIFKTTMQVNQFNNEYDVISTFTSSTTQLNKNYSNLYKTLLYSNFIPNTNINDNSNSYQLFDYDEIDFIYKLNNVRYSKISKYINNISDFYKKYFYKYVETEDNTQNIYYFKQLSMPIDVINIDNTGYFLSPLQNLKHMEISQPKQLLNNKNISIKATNKPYYKNMINYMFDRITNYSEYNNIPIYDLSFNFIDTINLNTYENLQNFLDKYNLNDIASHIIFIDNDYYGINLHQLLKKLSNTQSYNDIYITNLLTDLLSYIPGKNSINKYIDKYGIISKLNKHCINYVLQHGQVSSIFNTTADKIKYIFNKIYTDNFFVNDIPQNTIYTTNLNKNITIPNQFYNKLSTSLNFFNLKNTQTPQYEYDIELPSTAYDIISYQPQSSLVEINQTNSIASKDGTKLILDLQKGYYTIQYVSGIFYTTNTKSNIYLNQFQYVFFPEGISQISSNLTGIMSGYRSQYKNIKKAISSHIFEAATNAYDLTYNITKYGLKARSIDWNLPPKYKFNVEKFKKSKSTEKWYQELNQHDIYYYNTYFPSGCVILESKSCENIFALNQTDFKPVTNIQSTEPPYGQSVIAKFQIKTAKENLYLYFKNYIYGNCIFKIKKVYDENNNIETNIDNFNRMMLFDIDQNKSLDFNKNNISKTIINDKQYLNPIKNIVVNIATSASIYDEQIAAIDTDYANNYKIRMKDKLKNYQKCQFNEFHIENNRCAQIGKLNGLRIYENIGKTSENILWTTYKYITVKSNTIINAFTKNEQSKFKTYNINRFSNNMQKDEIGNIKYKGINNIKSMSINKTKYRYGFYDNTKQCFLCSARFFCSLPDNLTCTDGYCTFPYNNIDKTYEKESIFPNSIYNTNINNNYDKNFYILKINKDFRQEFKAYTDINVHDDLEVYFIRSDIKQDIITKLFDEEQFKYFSYKSIFQGFGGKTNENPDNILYNDYLMVNNKNNIIENIFTSLNISSYFNQFNVYADLYTKDNQATVNDLFSTIKMNSLMYKFVILDESKQEYFIDNNNVSSLTLSNQQTDILSCTINTILADSDYSFLLNEKAVLYGSNASYKQIPNHPQLTYQKISNTNLLTMLKTSKKYGNILKNYKEKKSLENSYILNNGFVISKYSPFNGPHTIKSNTIIKGLVLSGSNIDDILTNLNAMSGSSSDILSYIPEGYNIILRTVNWWDDTPKCQGTFSVGPVLSADSTTKLINDIIKISNKYDFIQTLNQKSIIKYNQGEYKKSNIYTIKIKNSGLNPQTNILENIKQYICLKEYINLEKQYQKLYDFITIDTIKYNIELQNQQAILQHYNALLYIHKNSDILFLQSIQPSYPTKDNYNIFYGKEKLQNYYITTRGYYALNKSKVQSIKQIKIDLRNNLQTAIKNSMPRYMPAETKLWKIIYEGK